MTESKRVTPEEVEGRRKPPRILMIKFDRDSHQDVLPFSNFSRKLLTKWLPRKFMVAGLQSGCSRDKIVRYCSLWKDIR